MAQHWCQSLTARTLAPLVALASCGDVDDTPDVPVASLATIDAELSGAAELRITVSDKESRLVNLTVLQGLGEARDAATASPESDTLRGLSTSPDGTTHRFTWDSVTDLGYERFEAVYLGVEVSAGGVDGIGDTQGPVVVDNTGQPRFYSVSGNVCRSSLVLGTPTGDYVGKLYVALYDDLAYPPMSQSVAGVDLGTHDLSDTSSCVPYAFTTVAPGNYQIICVLDDNNNNVNVGGYAIDAGDLTNAGGTQIQVVSADVQQDVSLNYAYDF